MLLHPLLLVVAALGEPAATGSAHDLADECQVREARAEREPLEARGRAFAEAADVCRRAFEAVPADRRDAAAFDVRSLWVFEAHRLYLRAHKAGGAERPICADRRMLENFASMLAELPPDARPQDRADVTDALGETALEACDAAPEPSTAPAPAVPAPIIRPAPHGADAPPPSASRVPRPTRTAGAVLLAAGLGLGAAALGSLVRGAVLRARGEALNAVYGNGAIPADQAFDPTAGKRADRLAIGFGLAGAALSAVGVALVAHDARRARAGRRIALTPSLLPATGLRFGMTF